jgi:probable HAF family extracellular repeat protein
MKSKTLTLLTAVLLFAALAFTGRLVAQAQQQQAQTGTPQYTITDLGTLGGTFSSGEGISDKAWVAGFSTLRGDTVAHAFLWRNGVVTDLGVPGLNSLVAYPFNQRGEVAIHVETSTSDPFGEDFCGFGTHLVCPPFLWQTGVLTQLPTLGGKNGFANQVNNLGEVGGVAENTTQDPTCQECVEGICPFQVLQTKPVLWKEGHIQELPTFPGDPDGIGLTINNNGQLAGTSGKCIGSAKEALHAVIWQNGVVTDLGNLGGTTNNHPQYINNPGQVVGYSNLPGDTTNHAFLWQKGVMIDLGTLPGDFASFGEAINDVGEVGGFSCDINFNCRAFLWQGHGMTDLNTLIPVGSPLFLLDVLSINSRGEIVGDALEISTGETHGYLAIPNHSGAATELTALAAQGQTSEQPKLVLPENVRKLLQQRPGFGRFVASTQKAALSGAATISAPSAALSPTSVTFSTEAIGTTSAAKIVTLKNTGTTSLTITAIAIAGTNAGDFAQTHTCGSSLAAGASCNISVTFKPTASGMRAAALRITDNVAGSPQQVTLSGIGTTAKLSPVSLSFSTQAIGTTSAAKNVTLTNVGATTLTITSIAVTGTNAGDFVQTHTCGSSLAAGATCSISVTFRPTASGARSAALSITDNAAGSPQQVALGGTGTTAKLFPTSLNFGTVSIGTTSPAKTVTLTNVGTTTLSIAGIAITGINAGDFVQTHTCGSSLAAGATCSVNITFKPKASGTRSASLSVSDNAAGTPQTVSLMGNCPGGNCLPQGAECPPQFPPCCPGLVCVPASTRAFCEKL